MVYGFFDASGAGLHIGIMKAVPIQFLLSFFQEHAKRKELPGPGDCPVVRWFVFHGRYQPA